MIHDLVIHTTEGSSISTTPGNQTVPPIKDRFDLAQDLWVERLNDDVADMVLDACEPSRYGVTKPGRLDGQHYAFVRDVANKEDIPDWDSDMRLQVCVALSRLVRPTSISLRYAARVQYTSSREVKAVFPSYITGHAADAYIDENSRDWLDNDDARELKQLLDGQPLRTLPERVKRAFWYHEFAARTEPVDVRWTLVSTALEALVHTDREQSTKQFNIRVSKLAAEVGIPTFGQSVASDAYDKRSSLAHGQGLAQFAATERKLYFQMESVLRAVLKRAVLNSAFAGIFSTDAGIRSQWLI